MGCLNATVSVFPLLCLTRLPLSCRAFRPPPTPTPLFPQVCREVPWAMRTYFLEEVTTTSKFRSQLANEWRRHPTTDPRVIDVMLFKASQAGNAHDCLRAVAHVRAYTRARSFFPRAFLWL